MTLAWSESLREGVVLWILFVNDTCRSLVGFWLVKRGAPDPHSSGEEGYYLSPSFHYHHYPFCY
jgi:hypothetical protein